MDATLPLVQGPAKRRVAGPNGNHPWEWLEPHLRHPLIASPSPLARWRGLLAALGIALALTRVATAQQVLDPLPVAPAAADSSPPSVPPADSLTAPAESLARPLYRGPFAPAADSSAAAAARAPQKPLDRSAWILWTPRITEFAIPRWQWYDSLFLSSDP
jgi:hypothetical protein